MWSNRKKSNIAIAILEKLPFLKGNKIISHNDGSNNIFADCRSNHIPTIFLIDSEWLFISSPTYLKYDLWDYMAFAIMRL